MKNNIKIKNILILCLLVFLSLPITGQTDLQEDVVTENIKGKGRVVDRSAIKLRWAPASPKAWLQGRNYGYLVERHTVMINNKWQDNPKKTVLNPNIKVTPLAGWKEHALKSDYAAVIAQAFYGEDFELNTTANDIGSIINRSSELEQRFTTSVFMAEYDYQAAELAGWAYTDNTTKENEKYLYRIILNRPQKQPGDTAAVFIGFSDKEDLLPPMELRAKWGDKSVMLTWNYELRSREYHSYHVERRSGGMDGKFERITELPFTILNADMREAFYIDSLQNNETQYSYRIIGLTSFGEESPASNVVSGQGEKQPSCIPQIYAGEFISETQAEIFWDFECDESESIDRLQLIRSHKIDGEYSSFVENIDKQIKTLKFEIEEPATYLKLQAIYKNNTRTESYPFRLQQIDSIPPAIPAGLEIVIDSLGVAHLSWQANTETDFQGYRILRSFAGGNEKSVITPQFVKNNFYTDTLSLNLKNEKVYYSLTALDIRYNESAPCPEVAAMKPNTGSLFNPRFTSHKVEGGEVIIQWLTDPLATGLIYMLERQAEDSVYPAVLYTGDYTISSFSDRPETTGNYEYRILVKDTVTEKITASVPLALFVSVNEEKKVSRFSAYVNEKDNYIELSWKKHPKAVLYRIYKQEGNNPMALWREIGSETNRMVDQRISVDTKYTYTILFTTQADGLSKASSVYIDY